MLLWDFTSEEKPKEAFWKWLLAAWNLWELFTGFRNSIASESDTLSDLMSEFLFTCAMRIYLNRVELRKVPEKSLDASHSTNNLIDSNFSEFLGSVLFFDLLELSLSLWNKLLESLLKEREVSSGLVGQSFLFNGNSTMSNHC